MTTTPTLTRGGLGGDDAFGGLLTHTWRHAQAFYQFMDIDRKKT
jgi:hypothetical protein